MCAPEPSSPCSQLQGFAEQQAWLQRAEGLKLEGNGKYKQGLYPDAISCYERAIALLQKLRSAGLPLVLTHLLSLTCTCTLARTVRRLASACNQVMDSAKQSTASARTGSPGEADNTPEARPLVKACFLNKSICHLKLGEYDDCIRSSTTLLDIDPSDYKARYRRGVVKCGPCRPACVVHANSPCFKRIIVQNSFNFASPLPIHKTAPFAPRIWPGVIAIRGNAQQRQRVRCCSVITWTPIPIGPSQLGCAHGMFLAVQARLEFSMHEGG